MVADRYAQLMEISPNWGNFPRPRVQVPPRTQIPAHFPRFHYRLNTRPCDLPLRGDFTGLRGQAALHVPGWAGNPPQVHRLTASADRLARLSAAGAALLLAAWSPCPPRGYITIPAALRHRCGLQPGNQATRCCLREPGARAVGRPAPGRADAVGHPAPHDAGQGQRGTAPQRTRRAQLTRAPRRRAALPVPARRGRRPDRQEGQTPPARSTSPAALPSTRRAVADTRLAEINHGRTS